MRVAVAAVVTFLIGCSIDMNGNGTDPVTSPTIGTLVSVPGGTFQRDGLSTDAARLRGLFRAQHLSWEVMEVSVTVRCRAAQPYPAEPVRSLDAIHLATMLTFQELYDPIQILSLDSRILANLEPLGLEPA